MSELAIKKYSELSIKKYSVN